MVTLYLPLQPYRVATPLLCSCTLLHLAISRHISPHLATSRHICGRLLQLAAQPADVAAASAAYARVQLPGVPLFWAANALQATLSVGSTL